MRRRLIPGAGAPADTLYAFYDLKVAPISFDFLWFLVGADYTRRQLGLARIDVTIVAGPHDGVREEEPDYELAVDTAARRLRVDNMLVPACGLLPTVANLTIAGDRGEAVRTRTLLARHVYPKGYEPALPTYHHPSECIRASREEGADIAVLRAQEGALRAVDRWLAAHAGGRRPVVITLRHYGYMPARNSNLAAWAAFAGRLDPREYCPIIIPDADQTLDGLPADMARFPLFSEASWNLGLRMAMYERAFVNLGISTGPMGLCQLNSRTRYTTFKMITPEVPQTTENVARSVGFTVGEQLPFATPFQKLVWHENDSLAVIEREFAAMVARIEGDAAAGDGPADLNRGVARRISAG